ncbi:ADP-ribosylglycohydrolase family protein [Cellulomonas sp. SG140]|uniref:ADP-ribosylglycohydrolase family protein n=1 Tax=Cellulomonas sp. SG140 TaxID=2976536 RepID=UPI0021E8C7D4|nr:ADP-ribosylglycohydrolase family protein [Cellulomonas sp. SG140]
MRLTWAQPEDLLAHELVQSQAEGKDVSAVRDRWVAAGGDPTPTASGASDGPRLQPLRPLAGALLDELDATPAPPDPAQPDGWADLAAILGSVADEQPGPDLGVRLAGAWTGRAAGCVLGKPVEKIPRQGIEAILRSTGRWPLDRYFTAAGLPDDVAARWPWNRRSAPTSLEENIAGAPEDDDLNFPMLALLLLERHGSGFSTEDVAQLWLDQLPAGRVFTAERAAYRNLLEAYPVPETARRRNPFREWIGALIRADVYGWTNPGQPLRAAELAWRDARLSHTRNGLYGAMWAAALGSAAMVADSVESVLDTASRVVPPASALADAIELGRRAGRDADTLVDGLDELHARYGGLHWVHVLPNAATIAFALERGQGRFGDSVCAAVTAGWDTDSVGATVGAVVGALVGVEGIGQRWTAPIDGRIATSLPGGEQRIDDLVARTARLAQDAGSGR